MDGLPTRLLPQPHIAVYRRCPLRQRPYLAAVYFLQCVALPPYRLYCVLSLIGSVVPLRNEP